MKILAADTSTSINTVAVVDDDRVLAEVVVACGRTHSERLIGTVDWVLEQASLSLEDVDALAISIGPGSFTGLRVGLATWKGLALGTGLPLAGVPTLDAMSRLGALHEGVVCCMLDARMQEVFGAAYRFEGGSRVKLIDDCVCSPEALLERLEGKVLFLGDGAAVYRDVVVQQVPEAVFAPACMPVPRAAAVAREALGVLSAGQVGNAADVAPVYLRKSQAEQAAAARRAAARQGAGREGA